MGTQPASIAAALRGMALRPDMTADLGRIACPTLVMVGQEDITSHPGRDAGHSVRHSRLEVRGDSGRRSPVALGEPGRGQCSHWRVYRQFAGRAALMSAVARSAAKHIVQTHRGR